MISVYRYTPGVGCEHSNDESSLDTLPEGGGAVWVDLEKPTTEEAEILGRVFGFHPLAIEDCWHEPQHPKVDDYGDYLFIVVHGVLYNNDKDSFDTHELNIFLGSNFLVTFHTYHSRSIEALKGNLQRHPHLMARGMDFMLHQIIDRVIDNYFPKLEIIEDKIDDIETAVLADPKPELLTRIFELRRTVANLKRVATQEREVLIDRKSVV